MTIRPRDLVTIITCLFVAIAGPWAAGEESGPVSLAVHVGEPAHEISPHLIGIFLKDINFGAARRTRAFAEWGFVPTHQVSRGRIFSPKFQE